MIWFTWQMNGYIIGVDAKRNIMKILKPLIKAVESFDVSKELLLLGVYLPNKSAD